ncbi:unnamed protein product [Symbiodinium necroappetens]|uniref:6-pyruvoyltetrahydropterin synthase n=1 Tax=Symbiodinium necroappetens TaxID=1628268 RepID=A0A812K665_9DINO|nr:unnamed protein product [Symbiodinium necroappetens]
MKNLERSYPGDMQEFKSEIERALAGQDGTTEVDYEKETVTWSSSKGATIVFRHANHKVHITAKEGLCRVYLNACTFLQAASQGSTDSAMERGSTRAATSIRLGGTNGYASSRAPSQVYAPPGARSAAGFSKPMSLAGGNSTVPGRSATAKSADKPKVPYTRVVSIDFVGETSGEMDLKIGDMIEVVEDDDGDAFDRWVMGKNLKTQVLGWIPLSHTRGVDQAVEVHLHLELSCLILLATSSAAAEEHVAHRSFKMILCSPEHAFKQGVRRHFHAKKILVKELIRSYGTFFIGVQDRCMYSHTFHFSGSEPFTTGCTAVVQVKVFGRSLGEGDVLMDISVGQQLLREIMVRYDHKNLDELDVLVPGGPLAVAEEEFQTPSRRNTTVEVMAEAVHKRFVSGLKQHLAEELARGKTLGSISKVEVVVKESDVAFAGFGEELDATSLSECLLLPGGHCCTSMTSMRYRSVSNVSADVDSKGAQGEAAAQLSVWGEFLFQDVTEHLADTGTISEPLLSVVRHVIWPLLNKHQRPQNANAKSSNEDEWIACLGLTLCLALFRVLTSAAGPDVFVEVGCACRRLHPPKAIANADAEDCAEFEFEVLPSDPHDMGPVLEVLHLEAEAGGALRLLPLLAECSSACGRVSAARTSNVKLRYTQIPGSQRVANQCCDCRPSAILCPKPFFGGPPCPPSLPTNLAVTTWYW